MKHEIKHEKFVGPIGVLFDLIDSRKLSVSEFSLTSVTEDFLSYVKNLKSSHEFQKEEVSQFILISSLLILLKSKTLVPELELTEEEDRDLQVLENQIKCFEILKSQTKIIKDLWGNIYFSAQLKHKSVESIFVPDSKMDIPFFHKYLKERCAEIIPKVEELKNVSVNRTVKIEDALTHVRNIIKRIKNLSFKNLNSGGDERLAEKNKKNVVILFLAVLELLKMGELDFTQENNFSDILICELSPLYAE